MKVKVKLFATLQRYGASEQTLELPEGSTVQDVIERLNIPKDIPLLRILNAVHVKPEQPLKDGDTLALFPPIAGGSTL
ncbi:MAG: MoaD/ThiS family protein [Nitrospirae bacterium]|nr:MAG: MoaD/ThiS family protein [Nitrospirota bacterium]